MKRSLLIPLVALLFIVILPACQENEFADWKILNDQWYITHQSDSGFITTPSGLCYKVIHQGVQRFPDRKSVITANYTGYLIDGTVFDSGQYYGYLSQTVEGWQEGISKMQNGGTYIFYIPSPLAYDTATTNSAIPPHSTLIFKVNLIDSYSVDSY